ncbi:hypothetical protein D3C78_962430 [compost metagenome]
MIIMRGSHFNIQGGIGGANGRFAISFGRPVSDHFINRSIIRYDNSIEAKLFAEHIL